MDGYGASETISSIKSDPVSIQNAEPIGAAEIIGMDLEGQELSADVVITDANGLGEFEYQWFRDSAPILGETLPAYTTTRNDV